MLPPLWLRRGELILALGGIFAAAFIGRQVLTYEAPAGVFRGAVTKMICPGPGSPCDQSCGEPDGCMGSSCCKNGICTADCGPGGTCRTEDQTCTNDTAEGECCGDLQCTPKPGSMATCQQPSEGGVCGNGITEDGEQCDDGNTNNADCCSAVCQHEPTTQQCGFASGACSLGRFCNGAGACSTQETVASATTVCRPSSGVCDRTEYCNGTSAICPADAREPETTVCRQSGGVCDVVERCTGNSNTCPLDAFASATTQCDPGDPPQPADSCPYVTNGDMPGYCTGNHPTLCVDRQNTSPTVNPIEDVSTELEGEGESEEEGGSEEGSNEGESNQENPEADLTVQGSDAENHRLCYAAAGLPPGLSINPNTGHIGGVFAQSAPQRFFAWLRGLLAQVTGGSSATYVVTVTAEDGYGGMDTENFNWTITRGPGDGGGSQSSRSSRSSQASSGSRASQGQSASQNLCGNGQRDEGEGCDDGNTQDGDGCSHDCKVEDGWECEPGGGGGGGSQGANSSVSSGRSSSGKSSSGRSSVRACFDTDLLNVMTVGTVTYAGQTYTDTCWAGHEQYVLEYGCEGPNSPFQYSLLCPSGFQCDSGRCVRGGPSGTGCRDTDGGINAGTKGTATGPSGVAQTDYCYTSNQGENVLGEFYCTAGVATDDVASVELRCAQGTRCIDGACRQFAMGTESSPGQSLLARILGFFSGGRQFTAQAGVQPFCSGDKVLCPDGYVARCYTPGPRDPTCRNGSAVCTANRNMPGLPIDGYPNCVPAAQANAIFYNIPTGQQQVPGTSCVNQEVVCNNGGQVLCPGGQPPDMPRRQCPPVMTFLNETYPRGCNLRTTTSCEGYCFKMGLRNTILGPVTCGPPRSSSKSSSRSSSKSSSRSSSKSSSVSASGGSSRSSRASSRSGGSASGGGGPDVCREICGDGKVVGNEQCDHGSSNGQPGDTCSSTCTNVSGGGSSQSGGSASGGGGSRSSRQSSPGGGSRSSQQSAPVGSRSSSQRSSGRSSAVQSSVRSSSKSSSPRSSSRSSAACGNGKIESGEQCDDGNRTNGDCCDSQCRIEAGCECTVDQVAGGGSSSVSSGVSSSVSSAGSAGSSASSSAGLMACPSGACSDSDGGNEPNVAGFITDFFMKWSKIGDQCDVPYPDRPQYDLLRENTCSGQFGGPCASGRTCVNGFCATAEEAQTIQQRCRDSDRGYSQAERGTITTPYGTLVDRCVRYDSDNPNVALLEEWVCTGDIPVLGAYTSCFAQGLVCRDGACVSGGTQGALATDVQSLCSDTDEGDDVTRKGTVNGLGFTGTDTCALPDGTPQASGYGLIENSCFPVPMGKYLPCPAGRKCVDGACVAGASGENPALSCTDSDGGIDLTVQGVNQMGGLQAGDGCATGMSDYVVEHYCSGSLACTFNGDTGRLIAAMMKCPAGQTCTRGRCGTPPSGGEGSSSSRRSSRAGTSFSEPAGCTDTDLGVDVLRRGTAMWAGNSRTDACVQGSNQHRLFEFYCMHGQRYSGEYPCPAGTRCFEGACSVPDNANTSLHCTDTDEGQFHDIPGMATEGVGSHNDECLDNRRLQEYYCGGQRGVLASPNNNEMIGTLMYCPVGTTCEDGACRQPGGGAAGGAGGGGSGGGNAGGGSGGGTGGGTICTDSDGGIVTDVVGELQVYGAGSYKIKDYCAAGPIIEHYCSNNTGNAVQMFCSEGKTCVNGFCATPEQAAEAERHCRDSDGGRNRGVRGTVIADGGYTAEDTCGGTNQLIEYVCSGNEPVSLLFNCQCRNGTCSN